MGSGMIEIVMDDDDVIQTTIAAPMDTTVPVLPPPAPPVSKGGHSRGRSFSERDNSIAGRFSKATDRFRSGSRNRKELSARPRGQEDYEYAPYESVPMPMNYGRESMRSPPAMAQKSLPTGLHHSEMI
ncbi:uncharacterized protein N0V96_001717 [Colletotrichum fioriniae]|uniref:uncharacterized protein n=1 Tax=Colletotrichum fioriniae TaxID=710243 RepID=UPI0032DA84D5|nr:hypothetical protein N0V96_001717 [Colletotrichum fioriniae]